MSEPSLPSLRPDAGGLCADCRHARRIISDRGSTFIQCRLAASDRRFEKYPRLPVTSCPGYEPRPGEPDGV